MNIRQEMASDFQAIYELVRASFAEASQSDGKEQDLVNMLRLGDTYMPELALIAQVGDEIVGYIMFTEIMIGTHTELALAPLAVAPVYQRRGVGSQLIEAGHSRAGQLGYHCSVVLGSERYYPRFGYVQASAYDIHAPFVVPKENFMVYILQKQVPEIKGIVTYPPVFFE